MDDSDFTYNIKWENLHGEIVSDFFDRLNENQLKYFVLRNYEGLPYKNTSKDIDLIVQPKMYHKAKSILLEILKLHQISNYKIVRYERAHCCYGIDISKNFAIHIDLIEGYLSKGFEIFSFDKLYANTIKYKNFRVLNEEYDAIMLLYYKVIGTKELKEKYQSEITLKYAKHTTEIDVLLSSTLGSKMGDFVSKALKKEDYETIVASSGKLSKSSKVKVFRRKPLKTTIRITKFLFEKFYRIVYCPRKFQNFISVQGADGTGKSTFIEGLVIALAFYNVAEESKSHVYHHRPKVLPNLGAAAEKAGVMKEDKNFTEPHRAKPAGFFSSFLRMTYYWLDYAIGVPLKLRKDVQFDRYTIYDRYIYDFLIDPKRSRIQLPYRLRKLFTKMVVQPRIVFVLLTDAETIYKRKQELTMDEIERQLIEFRKLAASHRRFVVLDASKPPEDLVEEAMKIIVDKFTFKL